MRPGGKEQSQERCDLLLGLCEGREGPRLYETLKPCRPLAVVPTTSEATVTEGRRMVLVSDGGSEFVSGCSHKEGLPPAPPLQGHSLRWCWEGYPRDLPRGPAADAAWEAVLHTRVARGDDVGRNSVSAASRKGRGAVAVVQVTGRA